MVAWWVEMMVESKVDMTDVKTVEPKAVKMVDPMAASKDGLTVGLRVVG